jgi:hypothetical protein
MLRMLDNVEARNLTAGRKVWPRDTLMLEAGSQQVLEELWSEGRLPFALRVGKITKAPGEYIIHFYDSRIHSAHVPLSESHSFTDIVRSAVLARVEEIGGPLWSPDTTPSATLQSIGP